MASSVIAGQITSNCFYLLQTFEKTWCAVLPAARTSVYFLKSQCLLTFSSINEINENLESGPLPMSGNR